MAVLRIEIAMDNDAFTENGPAEVDRILDKVDVSEDEGTCVDINGNTVGWWIVTEE